MTPVGQAQSGMSAITLDVPALMNAWQAHARLRYPWAWQLVAGDCELADIASGRAAVCLAHADSWIHHHQSLDHAGHRAQHSAGARPEFLRISRRAKHRR